MLEKYVYENNFKKNDKTIGNFKILFDKLYIGSLIKVDEFNYYLGGKTNNSAWIDSAVQVIFGLDKLAYLKKLVKACNINEIDDDSAVYYGISKDENIKMYKTIVEKMGTQMFLKKKNNKYYDFDSSSVLEKFSNLTIVEQSKQLLEMLNSLTDKKTTRNLKPLVTSSRSTLSLDISNLNSFTIINQSVTGLFENNIEIIK